MAHLHASACGQTLLSMWGWALWVAVFAACGATVEDGGPGGEGFETAPASATLVDAKVIRASLYTLTACVVVAAAWIVAQSAAKERERQAAVRAFVTEAVAASAAEPDSESAPAAGSAGAAAAPAAAAAALLGAGRHPPKDVVEAHVRCRTALFEAHAASSSPPLLVADKALESSSDFANSWQRKLPANAKAQLKAHLLKRTVATLPVFERRKREYEAKAALFQRRMISEQQWNCYRSSFEDLCKDVKLIVFEANALEEDYAHRPDGLMASAIKIVERQKEQIMQKQAQAQAEAQARAQAQAQALAQAKAQAGAQLQQQAQTQFQQAVKAGKTK